MSMFIDLDCSDNELLITLLNERLVSVISAKNQNKNMLHRFKDSTLTNKYQKESRLKNHAKIKYYSNLELRIKQLLKGANRNE